MTQIQLRRGAAASWTSNNPILAIGEVGYETDTLRSKIGDGVTAWNSLAYWQSAASFVQTIGDGTATTITLTHNLNTRNVIASVKRSSTHAEVECDVVAATVNTVTLTFATAPATNEFYATVISAGASTVSNAISSPIVTSSGNSLVLPTTNDTLVGRDTVDTLKNKTISGANNTIQSVPTSALTLSGAATANVYAFESTSSTSGADLTTTTDTVTVNVGASGIVLVFYSALAWSSLSGGAADVSFAASGANAVPAFNVNSFGRASGVNAFTAANTTLLTGLSPGSTTFKMKYRAQNGGTATFMHRAISVVPL